MARPLRISYPGAIYHITSRGNEKRAVFKDDQDRLTFLNILERAGKRYNWLCHAYCLMKNHYHLLIETPDGNISLGMRHLNGVYTQAFNRRHKRVGHLFQGRYKAIVLQKDSHLLEVCRYTVLNPVRAHIIDHPEQWRWSSYRAAAGRGKAHPCLTTDWVLGQFGSKRRFAEKEYRAFVKEGIGRKTIKDDIKAQSILGEDDFVNTLKDYIKGYRDIAEIPKSQRYMDRPELNDIFTAEVITRRSWRDKKVVDAVNKYGYTQREIAVFLGMHFTSISRIMREKG
ncbi:MAG TPA: transposase [Nitrospirae bacterium]|nr:transposase IS200 like protein [bacterium BMS3Abin10]GBE39967.1 transposase IS200 like protein [bacterium BMS3Bbin08]HDH00994.1 transposase [Nitrospirota bacterium]HDH50427.1 transposase [Nitrospirota bacterium]HDK81997.1 transposase [Nitrospirota bacterium]